MDSIKLFILLGMALAIDAQECGSSSFSPTPPPTTTTPSPIISSYIVGGQNAGYGDFPWQVGLAENGYMICGGVYVKDNNGNIKVITAAHCISNPRKPETFTVVFGMHSTTNTAGSRKVITAADITVHKDYNRITMSNDIAIIGFESSPTVPDVSGTFASPVCLPTQDYGAGEWSVVSGWGTTSEGGSSSSTLRYVWKPLLDRTYCNTETGNAGDIDETMLCAGDTGKDACQGDSGGPLVVHRNEKWELVGIVSWGYGCGRETYPGVYADVRHFIGWLQSNNIGNGM